MTVSVSSSISKSSTLISDSGSLPLTGLHIIITAVGCIGAHLLRKRIIYLAIMTLHLSKEALYDFPHQTCPAECGHVAEYMRGIKTLLRNDYKEYGFKGIITKPFNIKELSKSLIEVMNK